MPGPIGSSNECFEGETYATRDTSGSASRDPITLAAGGQRQGVDATLVPGGTSTVSGTVRNAAGVGVTDACVVVYLPNQYALFGQVAANGTYSVSGVPSGTFAVATSTGSGIIRLSVVHCAASG